MQKIKCPKCGEVFTVDESGYAATLKQVRDDEFNKEIVSFKENFLREKKDAIEIAVKNSEAIKEKEIQQNYRNGKA